MESQMGSQRGPSQAAPPVVGATSDASGNAVAEISADHARVLSCLVDVGAGLTVGQIGSQVSLAGPVVQKVLDDLVERRLVTKLNTVIPSYARRLPTAGVHAE